MAVNWLFEMLVQLQKIATEKELDKLNGKTSEEGDIPELHRGL